MFPKMVPVSMKRMFSSFVVGIVLSVYGTMKRDSANSEGRTKNRIKSNVFITKASLYGIEKNGITECRMIEKINIQNVSKITGKKFTERLNKNKDLKIRKNFIDSFFNNKYCFVRPPPIIGYL